jgi:hypothetical protein
MWRLLVFVKKAGDGQRVGVGGGWSVDHTEGLITDGAMDSARRAIQTIYSVVNVSLVDEWGAESDGEDEAPLWVRDVLTAAGVVAECGSWVEVNGQPFAFVALVEQSLAEYLS